MTIKISNFTQTLRRILYRYGIPKNHYCVICKHTIFDFLPYRNGSRSRPPLISALQVIGSNIDHFECPACGCHDRERHLILYMQTTGICDFIQGKHILHFAPERQLSSIIQSLDSCYYLKCDLYPQASDVVKIDILAIPYETESFDLVIANHVLEHVTDDLQAVAEIHRVLKPGGYAILQTPYSLKPHHTWSDPGIDTDIARLHAYGQEDHVRLFGRDIFDRLTSVGLESCVGTHNQLLGQYDPNKYGVNENEPFFLFKRSA